MSQPNSSDRQKQARTIRDTVAVILALAALVPIWFMFSSETLVNPWVYDPSTQFETIRQGFRQYCWAFGLILFLVGLGVLLLNYNDKLETNPAKLVPEDED